MTFNLEHEMDLEISKNSFPYFFQHVCGPARGYEKYDYPYYMEEWLSVMQGNKRSVFVCSRGHGKSVFMHCWAVWNLIFQPTGYEIVYVSSNQKQTNMHMKEISKYFNFPPLQKFKPQSKGWAVEEMNLTNGNSIKARSVNAQIRGLHPNEIIIDDPLKEFSMSGIQKVTDWFFSDLIPTLDPKGFIRIIGTPFSYTDIYSKLAENSLYSVRVYPCLNSLNEPLWVEKWNYHSLMERKNEIGTIAFTREYLCVPMSTGTSLFNPEYLDSSKSKDLILRPQRRKDYKYYVGVDPAISTDGDYNVITVLEVDKFDNKSVVYIDKAKNVQFRENIEKVRLIGKIFNPEVIFFETNTFAKSFTQELRNVSDVNVHDFHTTRKRKQEIILNLQMNFENGKMVLPYGNEESRRVTSALVEELSMFAITDKGKFEGIGAHDDMVMSLALANAATHEMSDTYILLDDLDIFSAPVNPVMQGIVGLNF
jgi:hypothetical protein